MDCTVLLSHAEPFLHFEEGLLRQVSDAFHEKRILSGKAVYPDGAPIREIGFIASGRVSLGVFANHDTFIRFDILTQGDFIGLEALALDNGSPIQALCESPVRCFFQPKEAFLRTIAPYPEVREYFYKKAIKRLVKAVQALHGDAGDGALEGGAAIDAAHYPRAIEKALLFIEKNYMNDITLDQIADVNGMSKYHFTRVFKKKTGYTFKQYLNKKRIEEAKRCMNDQDMTVSEAGITVGYNDLAYFSRVFQKTEGMAPSQYRKGLK